MPNPEDMTPAMRAARARARLDMTGEDKVIVVCVLMLTILTIVALIALVIKPDATNTIIPVMAATVIAISTLAARHPPVTGPIPQDSPPPSPPPT